MSQTEEISVIIEDETKVDKINEIDTTDEDGSDDFDDDETNDSDNPITIIELSPNEKYLVSYSQNDDSIFGWNVENVNEGQPEPEFHIKLSNVGLYFYVKYICVSNDKKLVYLNYNKIVICDIMNDCQEIKLDCNVSIKHCSFNLKDELILLDMDNYVYIYSTQTKNNKWKCKRIYRIPEDFKLISMSKYDRIYLLSDNSIYEWNLITNKSTKMLTIDEEIKIHKHDHLRQYIEKNIIISSNEKFICLRYKDKIIIFSVEFEIPIASLDNINNDNQLRMLMKNLGLHLLLPPLFPLLFPLFSNVPDSEFWNSIMEDSKEMYLSHSEKYDQSPKMLLLNNIRVTSKYAFVILDGDIWKIDLEKMILKINSLPKTFNELNNGNFDESIENLYIIIHSFNFIYNINTIHKLCEDDDKGSNKLELSQNSIKWEISSDDSGKCNIELRVFKKNNVDHVDSEWDLPCSKVENFNLKYSCYIYKIKLLSDSDIIILTTIGLLIYHFNEDNNSISLNYFYYLELNRKEKKHYYDEVFSKDALPLPNYDSFQLCDGWVTSIKNNKELLLKYGLELLAYAINEHNLELIDEFFSCIKDNKVLLLRYGEKLLTYSIKEHNLKLIDGIYKKCILYFKDDLRNNTIFLSIITSTMLVSLNKYYPEYITRYSLETSMIIDSPIYNTERLNDNLHLYSFQYPHIINLTTQFILWKKYEEFLFNYKNDHKTKCFILAVIQILIILPFLPIYFATFYILYKRGIINITENSSNFAFFYFYVINHVKNIFSKFSKNIKIPTFTFMNPYINFVNYPQEYNWLELIKPQPSPFIETISRDIYNTWSGESLINFKWNTYGKYYYAMIWIGFIALLGCFTVVATIPPQYIGNDVQKQLLVTSIILGFIHLSFEIRQIIYDPIKWISDFWNIFEIITFLLPICTSIYWLQTNIRNIQLLSFTCLFLDIKFLLFFRVFESFGIYFAIIISVAKQIISFLVVLFIFIISFAHALFILLTPQDSNYSFEEYTNNNDSNNPWNIAPTYHQIFENGTSNLYMIQQPDENTNMFVDFRTALFAMYLFLTGDSSALTNWPYIDNPSLAIIIVLFSLLIVVYLMNLFIGLLNNAIEKDNNRVSYLVQKVEILAEIELFYLLPHQRRWNTWFPEVLYYYINIDKTREKIKEMMEDDWDNWYTDEIRGLKVNLLNKLNIQPVDETSLQQLFNEVQDIRENSMRKILEEIQKLQSKS